MIMFSRKRLPSCSPGLEKLARNEFTSGYMERIRFWSTHIDKYHSTLQNLTVKIATAPITIIESEYRDITTTIGSSA